MPSKRKVASLTNLSAVSDHALILHMRILKSIIRTMSYIDAIEIRPIKEEILLLIWKILLYLTEFILSLEYMRIAMVIFIVI